MTITYTFADGTVSVAEAGGEAGAFILASRRHEAGLERQEHRKSAFSLDGSPYEGGFLVHPDEPLNALLEQELREELASLLDTLTPVQRRRLLLTAAGLSARAIARAEGCDHKAVLKSLAQARKKLQPLLPR